MSPWFWIWYAQNGVIAWIIVFVLISRAPRKDDESDEWVLARALNFSTFAAVGWPLTILFALMFGGVAAVDIIIEDTRANQDAALDEEDIQ